MNEQQSGGQLSELALIVARLSETVARQQQEIGQLREAVRILAETPPDDEPEQPQYDLAGRPIR